MTNEDKIRQILNCERCKKIVALSGVECNSPCDRFKELKEMAEWKDKQINLLLDSIDHAYLQTDGTYGDLCYEVSDKVKYLKNILKQPLK